MRHHTASFPGHKGGGKEKQGRSLGMRLTHLPGQTVSHPPNVSCPSSSTSDQVVHILPFPGDSDDTDVPSILLSEKLNQLADSHWN